MDLESFGPTLKKAERLTASMSKLPRFEGEAYGVGYRVPHL